MLQCLQQMASLYRLVLRPAYRSTASFAPASFQGDMGNLFRGNQRHKIMLLV